MWVLFRLSMMWPRCWIPLFAVKASNLINRFLVSHIFLMHSDTSVINRLYYSSEFFLLPPALISRRNRRIICNWEVVVFPVTSDYGESNSLGRYRRTYRTRTKNHTSHERARPLELTCDESHKSFYLILASVIFIFIVITG
jgi:hypothetical protein